MSGFLALKVGVVGNVLTADETGYEPTVMAAIEETIGGLGNDIAAVLGTCWS